MLLLTHVKRGFGYSEQDPTFNNELLIHIGRVVSDLVSLGVDELEGVLVREDTQLPSFSSTEVENLVLSVLFLKVKMVFDPSPSETINKNLGAAIAESEERIKILKSPDPFLEEGG